MKPPVRAARLRGDGVGDGAGGDGVDAMVDALTSPSLRFLCWFSLL